MMLPFDHSTKLPFHHVSAIPFYHSTILPINMICPHPLPPFSHCCIIPAVQFGNGRPSCLAQFKILSCVNRGLEDNAKLDSRLIAHAVQHNSCFTLCLHCTALRQHASQPPSHRNHQCQSPAATPNRQKGKARNKVALSVFVLWVCSSACISR